MPMLLSKNKMKRYGKQRGQVSIEALAVLLIWVVVCFLFLAVMLVIASMMLNQTAVNKTVQQVSSLGCVPDGIADASAMPSPGIGTRSVVSVEAVHANLDPMNPDPDTLDTDLAADVPACGTDPDSVADPVPGGNLIKLTVTYEQTSFLPLPGSAATFDMTRSATSASGRLEGGP